MTTVVTVGIKVDGKIWPYSIGQSGRIEPGRHTIACGGDIQIDIPRGVVFKFDSVRLAICCVLVSQCPINRVPGKLRTRRKRTV